MRKSIYTVILTATLALAACGSSNPSPANSTASSAPPAGTIVVPKSNVFSPMVDDLNKAKQLKAQSEKNKDALPEPAPTAATANDAQSNPP
jgi:hypothetical protein